MILFVDAGWILLEPARGVKGRTHATHHEAEIRNCLIVAFMIPAPADPFKGVCENAAHKRAVVILISHSRRRIGNDIHSPESKETAQERRNSPEVQLIRFSQFAKMICMHLISRRPLEVFWKKHGDAEQPLRVWIKAVESASWHNLMEVRITFPHADPVGKFTVFNIGGNKYRLITVIHYNRQKIYVRHILNHAEYDLGKWKKE